jgi:2-hydroxychromene-2-carboxylate isomerase
MQKVLNKLAKNKKVKLNKKQVKLSLMQSIKTEADAFLDYESTASYYAYERLNELADQWMEAVRPIQEEVHDLMINYSPSANLQATAETLAGYLSELRQQVEDLGVDPSEVEIDTQDGTMSLEELEERVSNAEELNLDFRSQYIEYVNYTGDRDFL